MILQPRRVGAIVTLAVAIGFVGAPPGEATAGDKRAPSFDQAPFYGSSLLAWVDAVAAELEARVAESGRRTVRLDVRGGRGVADRKASRVFRPRLTERLATRGRITDGTTGPLATIELSLEGGLLWAVGIVEGDGMPGPAALAVSWPVDRELEAVLAAPTSRTGQARWTMERLGTVPAGVLDIGLVDLDGDRAHEIVLLSVDGVRALRFGGGDPRPEIVGGPWALPGQLPWPRVVAGWLATIRGTTVQVATTAGHSALFDAGTGRWSRVGGGRGSRLGDVDDVPLRQTADPSRDTLLLPRAASSGPDLDATGIAGLPPQVRDAVQLPAEDGGWLWISASGELGGLDSAGDPAVLPTARVGDRFVAADLDGDGTVELVTTDATPPGEPDQVTIWRLDDDLRGHGVLFRAGLDAGSVVALSTGDLDFDGVLDLLLVEEGPDAEAVLWRIERSR